METFETMRDTVLEGVREVGKKFTQPDDDWIPVAWAIGPSDSLIAALAVPKEQVRGTLRALRRSTGATFMALVASAWAMKVEGWARSEVERIMDEGVAVQPERQEVVLVECSDGRREEVWMARILRDDTAPPVLAEWAQTPTDSAEGRLAGVCLTAFDEVSDGRA